MAITVTPLKSYVTGDRKTVHGTILFDNAYPTGGYALTGTTLGLALELNEVDIAPHPSRVAFYNYATSKVQVYTALGTEATNASDQSSITVRFRAVGKGKA